MSGLSSGVREVKARGIWSEVEEGESDCMLYSYIFRIIFSAGCNRICFHGAAYSIFGYYEESCGVDYDRYAAVEFCAGVYRVLWGGVWVEILSAACSPEKVRGAKGRSDSGSSMGNLASAVGFLFLCDPG